QGILNCGATANAQYNIDTQGDMPTGCSSPYMVSVTATDDNDVRTFSAYGATTIDLGAPGDAVFLPSGTSGYGNTSGTSFASPCVAGAIALVYSAPCPDLMGLALSNPQAAADLVLGYILDGTDEVNNLIGETVTGGRLNVYNALELALANCGPIECSTDSIYASSSCVYDASLGEAVTEIQLGVELGSFLCSTTTVCQSNDLDSLGTMCDSLMIASGETYTFSGMYPSASYAFYVTVDSLVSDTIMVSTPACDTLVPGCTTAVDAFGNEALNFDPLATIDDGSCEFPCVDFSLTILTDCWPEEVGWELVLGDTVVASVDAGGYSEAETEVSFEQCLTQGCYTFVLTDEYGDGLNGAAWNQCGVDGNYTATDSSGTVLFAMGEADYGDEIQHEFCLPAVFGCTNPDACNFDALANTDNGLCEVPGDPCDDGDENTVFDEIGDDCMCTGVPTVFGCTDEDACNYNELANVDDESCYTLGEGSISGPLFPFAGGESTYTYNGAIGDSFIWTVVGGEITEGQGTSQINVIWGSEPGGASVTVLEADSTGCEGEVVRTVQILAVDNVIGLDNVHLELVPNPARGRVFFDWGVSDIQQANVVLYDVLGANVLQATTSAWLDLEGIAPGRYTVV
ncbi:MAG: S8 family serine peptidase, partial [Bacteroidota bacterium]|nr:S8 family serine peptidase [Bacteroidota bacterium]